MIALNHCVFKIMNNCPICGDDRYATLSVFCRSGHLSMCKRKHQKQLNEQIFEYLENDHEELMNDIERNYNSHANINLDKVLPENGIVCNEFLKKQNLRLSQWGFDHITVGACSLLSGERKTGNLRSYLLLAKFITNCFGLSAEDATELVKLLKYLSHLNGNEIPIPAKFNTVKERLLSSLNYLKIYSEVFELKMPISLFTETVADKMPRAEGIIANVLDIVGKILVY